jgi:hypothetical protein
MSEPPTDPATSSDPEPGPDAVELLVRAVGELDAADRDRVFAWLLRRDAGSPALAWPAPAPPDATTRRRAWALHPELQSTRLKAYWREALTQGDIVQGLPGSPPAAQQMVPVRFSTDQHAKLRVWCAEHGFSMATVIRGLVARFLEGQLPERP